MAHGDMGEQPLEAQASRLQTPDEATYSALQLLQLGACSSAAYIL